MGYGGYVYILPCDLTNHPLIESFIQRGYDPKALGEVPLPHDWQDPNFNHRGGRYSDPMVMLMGKVGTQPV